MLSRLAIEHIALIDRLELDIPSGLVIITGETGAGKSIVIDSVNLVLGERADKDLIQSGAERAKVEALFEIDRHDVLQNLEERGVEAEDGQLILARELAVSGRNVCRINGRLSSLSMLKDASDLLVDIHGQHEHQYLLHAASHLSFLDGFGGKELQSKREEYREKRGQWKKVSQMVKAELGSEEERNRQRAILSFQIEEIEAGGLIPGEDKALEAERALLANFEEIQSSLLNALSSLHGDEESEGAVGLVSAANNRMVELVSIAETYGPIQSRLANLYYELDDLSGELAREVEGGNFDPYRYEEVERRLEQIHGLKRKYGDSVDSVLAFKDRAVKELDALEEREVFALKGDEMLRQSEGDCYGAAFQLHEAREAAAEGLEKQLMEQLKDLSLEKSAFQVSFSDFPSMEKNMHFGDNGLDDVEFLLSTNPGEPLKPLRKVASGGELSRIMLAFKAIAAQNQGCDTLIFDEIDTGISGKTAAVVGEKMHAIARHHQVLCVTHSAQIAAHADHHLRIEKVEEGGRTHTHVRLLNEEEHVEELARIVGGAEATAEAVAHARELVRRARG